MFHRVALALAFAPALAGCMAAPSNGTRVEHRPGEGPKTHSVPYDATYVLQLVDETGAGAMVLERVAVERKFQIGFIRDGDGGLVAYAGGRKFPLSEDHYVWQIAPDAQKSRGDVMQAKAGPVIATAGEALVDVGAFIGWLAGQMLYGFASTGGVH